MTSKEPLKNRLEQLLKFLGKVSLFRDGFIDQWERNLVPEIDLNILERRGFEQYIQKQRSKGKYKDDYSRFETMMLMTPIQWEKVNAVDAQGKPIPFKIPYQRAKAALAFYQVMIRHVADPQRQLRMGATAIKIFRQINPNASFEEELKAIGDFFPFASSLRDQELNNLLENHVLPSLDIPADRINAVRKLYTAYQSMQYDSEVSSANAIEQTIKAVLTGASRESRIEILLWILDPANNPIPKILMSLKDKLNITFNELPKHVSFLPEGYRQKILENIFLGENGLFSPQNEKDHVLMKNFCDQLFVQFFPERNRKDLSSGKQQFDQETYDLLKEVFAIVMEEYPPARRTSVVLSLLNVYKKLGDMSDGQKLVILLSAIGPVGVKIGQVLSENQGLVASESLRSDLGSLKSNAPPISKFAVLEVLAQAGIPLANVRIGRRVATASMGQVHVGWYKINDQWKPVIIKVLKPKINRLISQDMVILDKVLDYLKTKHDKDLTHISNNVRHWIDIEGDFRNEANNMEEIRAVVKAYMENYDVSLPLKVPEVYVGDKKEVIIEELMGGIEVEKIMDSNDFKNEDNIIQALTKKGFSQQEARDMARQILATPEGTIVSELRQLLLFMFFENGTFHADLHKGNVMAEHSLNLIDLGFIGRFKNKEQSDGAKQFLKGVIIHNEDDVIAGLTDIHVYAVAPEDQQAVRTQIEGREVDLRKGIRKIFASGHDIKQQMLDIMALVTEMRFSGNQDFSDFIKALTTAIWLFPTDLSHALETLNALKVILDLDKEKDNFKKAVFAHGLPILRQGIKDAWSQWKERNIAPWLRRWANLKDWIETQRDRRALLKKKQEAIFKEPGISSTGGLELFILQVFNN